MPDYDDIPLDQLQAELSRRQRAARAILGIPEPDPYVASDAAARAGSAARAGLASGAVGDVGAPDINPYDAARLAISDGIRNGLSHREAFVNGVGEIRRAAHNGDKRVIYKGRTEPGA